MFSEEKKRAKQIARFMSKIDIRDPHECWPWLGTVLLRDGSNYGRFSLGKDTEIKAHRFMYELVHGALPDDKLVCHACDNPKCVNPQHLWVGTPSDNMTDMVRKGRNPDRAGEKHPLARLTEDQVKEMRRLYKTGWSQPMLADKYGMSRQHVGGIVTGQRWSHI